MITVFLPQANDPENFGILETRRASLVGRLTRPCNPPLPHRSPRASALPLGLNLAKLCQLHPLQMKPLGCTATCVGRDSVVLLTLLSLYPGQVRSQCNADG